MDISCNAHDIVVSINEESVCVSVREKELLSFCETLIEDKSETRGTNKVMTVVGPD